MNDNELDLGNKENSHEMPPTEAGSVKEPKVCYPKFTIKDEAYDRFVEKFGMSEVGDETDANVRLVTCAIRKDEYERSMEVEVRKIIGYAVEVSDETDSNASAADESKT